ncbi:hypothetical protein [Streptomyces sp. NBC_00576]|uniref:hypothetical protein n=1 Tax=Streptomyces sp. NBC_00576 TaxID=2903665 RepID=UPI002E81CF00|nr:hypothetical protein [Streptomyces sp. NBC_00576]WUB72568.1 hypothetical protein OG734_22000 [Streptomyces sp. NBC_00576]
MTSGSLYEDVVSGGGKFIEPERYTSARLTLKEGETTAWFHLPGRAAPGGPVAAPTAGSPRTDPPVNIPVDDSGTYPSTNPGTDSGTSFAAQGDISVHHDNTYQQPVHIGRRKGGGA